MFSVIVGVIAIVGCGAHIDASSTATYEPSKNVSGNGGLKSSTPARARLVPRKALVVAITPGLAQRDAEDCRSWKYESSSLTEDFSSMKEITKSDWGRSCYQYACSAKGDAELDGRVYHVEVNAGGWIALEGPDGVTTFRASAKQSPGFLAACDCCE
jgi:hypothetical protein